MFQGTIKQYKGHLRKLLKQKKGYEEVITYFKEEMTLMAEQLCNLQELLVSEIFFDIVFNG